MIEKISLNALKFFYFVAMYESVTKASEKLFVTQSAVSKQIKNLEEMLGISLFIRVGKSLHLTPSGQQLYACCQQVFPRLNTCLSELTEAPQPQKQLVLSCEPTLSMKWLIPRLSEFNALNLGFEIVLLTGGGAVDFTKQAVDIAIRRNDFAWGEGVYHEKIADEYIAVVRNPHRQDKNTLLLSSSRPKFWQHLTDSQLLDSNLWDSSLWDSKLWDYEHVILEHFYLCIEGCLAGLGTTIVSAYMIEKELSHQSLQLVQPPIKDGSAYHLLSATPFYEDKRKVLFKEWLINEMRASEVEIESWFA